MPTQLHQLLAVENGAKKTGETALTNAYKAIQRSEKFDGFTRTYAPHDADGETLPPEENLVQTTVPQLIESIKEPLTRLIDVTATKDAANTGAHADIVLEDGTVLATGVPATTLLWLEKKAIDFATFAEKLPTLDPAHRWEYDENSGVFRTNETKQNRTKKVPQTLIKYEATDKHPAQTERYDADVVVGTFSRTDFSGAITADRKAELVKRANAFADAVKKARMQANSIEVTNIEIGAGILGYLYA